jgi:hypothetical protein
MTTDKIMPILNRKLVTELRKNNLEIKLLGKEYQKVKQSLLVNKEEMKKIGDQLSSAKNCSAFGILSKSKEVIALKKRTQETQLKSIQDSQNEKVRILKNNESKHELINDRIHFDRVKEKELREEIQQEDVAEVFINYSKDVPLYQTQSIIQNSSTPVTTSIEFQKIIPDAVRAKIISSSEHAVMVHASVANNQAITVSVVTQDDLPFKKIDSNKNIITESLRRYDIELSNLTIAHEDRP